MNDALTLILYWLAVFGAIVAGPALIVGLYVGAAWLRDLANRAAPEPDPEPPLWHWQCRRTSPGSDAPRSVTL